MFLPSTPCYFHEKFGPSFNCQSVICQHVRLPVVTRNRNFAEFVLYSSLHISTRTPTVSVLKKLCLTFLCICAQKVKLNFQHLVKASSEFDVRRRRYQCSGDAITLHFYIQLVYLTLSPAAKGEMLKRIWKRRRRRRKLPTFGEERLKNFTFLFQFSIK